MSEFIPQAPRANTSREKAIAAIIDRLRLRQDNFIYESLINDWLRYNYCESILQPKEIEYIAAQTGLGVFFIDEEDEATLFEEEEGD